MLASFMRVVALENPFETKAYLDGKDSVPISVQSELVTISVPILEIYYDPAFLAHKVSFYWDETVSYNNTTNHHVTTTFSAYSLHPYKDEAEIQSAIARFLTESILSEFSYPDSVIKTIYDWILARLKNPVAPATNVAKDNSVSSMAMELPGMTIDVISPCECFTSNQAIYYLVQHLNDQHKWSREKIADWLDELMDRDGIDLTFKVD